MNPKEQEAVSLLNLVGARVLPDSGGMVIGVWRDLWGDEIKEALKVAGVLIYEVTFLDIADVAPDYRTRHCPQRRAGESFLNWRRRAEAVQLKRLAWNAA